MNCFNTVPRDREHSDHLEHLKQKKESQYGALMIYSLTDELKDSTKHL